MQQIRGFVCFGGKALDEIRSSFRGFRLDSANLMFFGHLSKNNKEISKPGVFITGSVDDRYSSKDIVNILEGKTGPEGTVTECDISVGSEDVIKHVVSGDIKGNYFGIRIRPPYDMGSVSEAASNLGKVAGASDVLVRTVESGGDKPLVCIDIITGREFKNYKKVVEEILSSKGLNLAGYTIISLEQS